MGVPRTSAFLGLALFSGCSPSPFWAKRSLPREAGVWAGLRRLLLGLPTCYHIIAAWVPCEEVWFLPHCSLLAATRHTSPSPILLPPWTQGCTHVRTHVRMHAHTHAPHSIPSLLPPTAAALFSEVGKMELGPPGSLGQLGRGSTRPRAACEAGALRVQS